MVGGECSKIGDKEKVKEELYGVCFMALGENEMFVIGACERVLDPGHSLVQAF